jgi:hypothetical protein
MDDDDDNDDRAPGKVLSSDSPHVLEPSHSAPEHVFCRPDQCSFTNSYVNNNSSLISE